MVMDKRAERELVLRFWAQNKTEEEIANSMNLTSEQVHSYIYNVRVTTAANISNIEEAAREMCKRGKTEDEIAGILDIDVRQVRSFLERR